jgi:hypothetical protein
MTGEKRFFLVRQIGLMAAYRCGPGHSVTNDRRTSRSQGPWVLVHCWSHLRRRFVRLTRNTKSPAPIIAVLKPRLEKQLSMICSGEPGGLPREGRRAIQLKPLTAIDLSLPTENLDPTFPTLSTTTRLSRPPKRRVRWPARLPWCSSRRGYGSKLCAPTSRRISTAIGRL